MTRRRKVTVTGASGQLGTALLKAIGDTWNVDPIERTSTDVREWRAVRARIAAFAPDLVIHCAAATDVDGCERDPELAFNVNAKGSRNVAQAAALVDAEFVCVSTNYVFDGASRWPYHEFDLPNPISVYGASKLAGESEARAATHRCHVVRTSWLYGRQERNFVATMRRLMSERDALSVVADQTGNPTYVADVASALLKIVESGLYGTWHVVNSGETSWHGWATEIAAQTGATTAVEPIPAAEYPRAATPPANGTMTSLVLPGIGVEMPDWRDALTRCLRL